MRFTTTGATSITLPGAEPLKLRRGVWTDVDSAGRIGMLMSPTPNGPIFRCEVDLAPYFVTCRGDKGFTVTARYDWRNHPFTLRPGKWTEVDRVAHAYLVRHRDTVRGITVQEMLESVPDARILIQRGRGFGDLLLMTPAVRKLVEQYPKAKVSIAVDGKHSPWVKQLGLYTNVYNCRTMFGGAPYHLDANLNNYVEMHGLSSSKPRPDIFAIGLGVRLDGDYRMVCNADPGPSLLPDVERPVAVDLCGSMWTRGPSYGHAVNVVNAIAAAGFTPVHVHQRRMKWWPGSGVDLSTCSIVELLQILRDCYAVLSVDTGTLHAANALGRPTVGLFGPIPSGLRVVGQSNCLTIDSKAPCHSCMLSLRKCSPKTRARCFDAISPDEIVDALREVTA